MPPNLRRQGNIDFIGEKGDYLGKSLYCVFKGSVTSFVVLVLLSIFFGS
jgi:hypothetical protein